MRRLLILFCAVLCVVLPAQAQETERRVALVIGNAGYGHVDRLANPGNDAKLIADTLQHLGFSVIGNGVQRDLDKAHFDQLVQEFGRQIQGADVALFYYAGHGMQVQGTNWLLPVDANPTRLQDLDFQMINAELVLRQMDGAGTRLNILLLDACRNNPFANLGSRSLGGGLAQMRAPEGTLISFATQPGNVAVDGSGANGPYAAALAETMRVPGLDIFRLFNRVGLKVKRETQGNQQPWVSSSPIDGDFYFASSETAPDAAAGVSLDANLIAEPANRTVSTSKETQPANALQSLQALAEKGQPEAQTDLALLYAKGQGVTKDYAIALQWFERAAGQSFAPAQYLTGLMYERGYGARRSYSTALQWYRRAAEQNYSQAEIAAARFYGRGISVPRDPAQRDMWLRRAADQQSPVAQYILGNIYRQGTDVPQDTEAAIRWYQSAAKQNYVFAQVRLGRMYEHGEGVKQDYTEALQWFRRAAAAGNASAQNSVGLFYEHGWSVPKDYAQAQHWFRLAADQGNGYGAFNLGVLYADGLGVPRDKAEATRWFEKAAAVGNEQAVARLARMEPPASASPAKR